MSETRVTACVDCGASFDVLKPGRLPKRCPAHSSSYKDCDVCGKQCRPAVGNSTCLDCQERHCRWCAEPITGARWYCDERCKGLHRRKELATPCGHCGKQFVRDTGNQKYCSTRCRGRRARELFKERYPDEPPRKATWTEARKAAWQARRELKKAAQVGPAFTPAEIFERDGWICGPCGEPVDPQVAWPDTRCATVDHIIPLSRGGEHSRGNVQTAHLGCNVAKSDSVPVT